MRSIRNALSKSAKIIADERKRVWLQAWTATASSSNCIDEKSCDRFANACLRSYDERFGTK